MAPHSGARTVGSADRVANIASAALHSLPTRTQTMLCQCSNATLSLLYCPMGVSCLPLVRHQFSILVDKAVVEVELRVGQLRA